MKHKAVSPHPVGLEPWKEGKVNRSKSLNLSSSMKNKTENTDTMSKSLNVSHKEPDNVEAVEAEVVESRIAAPVGSNQLEYYTTLTEQLKAKYDKLVAEDTARLRESGMNYYVPNPVQYRFHKSTARTILLCGANRIGKCVTYSTLIDTPDGEVSIGKLYEEGEPFDVYAWDGNKKVVAKASAPFRKPGLHKCYRIKLSDERWIEAADNHRILMQNGHWAFVSDLSSSSLPSHSTALSTQAENTSLSLHYQEVSAYPLESISDTYQSAHALSGQNSLQTAQDYQGYCSSDFRQYGEPLHASQDTFQSFLPLQACALQQHRLLSCSDDQESKCTCNHLQCGCRLSTQDVRFQTEAQSSESLSQTSYTTCLRSDDELQEFYQQLHASSFYFQPSHEVFLQGYPSDSPLLLEANKIVSYEPIGYQEVYDFEVEHYHNYFAGGLVNHNSTAGVMELCWHLTKKYPDWFPKERRFDRPIKAAISVDSFDKVANVIEPKIKSFLPRDYYRIRRKAGYLWRIECKDGSFVSVLTLEMDDSAYESADWDFVWEDEPQDQRKREGLIRGLVDRRGYEVITFTPLTEAWMKTELVDKADSKRIEVFFAQMRDNRFDISGNQILSEESIKEFEEALPEEIREIRVDGQFFTLRGRVYKEFSDAHILDFKYAYPDPVICILDPHDRLPHHVIWAYVDRTDDIFIDYEMIVRCELDDLAYKIKRIEAERGYKMRKRLIDPNFGLKPAKPGCNWSVKDELTKHGTSFYPANDEVELGHMLTRDYLHYDRKREMTATNRPKVFFARDRVPQTIHSMRNLQYDEWTAATRMKRNPKEETQEKDSHGADTVRYLLVGKPRFRVLQDVESYEMEGAAY